MSQKPDMFTLVFASGAALVVLGLVCSYYPSSVIAGLEGLLRGSLSQVDRWMYEGSLSWWQVERLTVYQPISYLLMACGGLVIVYAVLSKAFSLAGVYLKKVKLEGSA